MRSAHQENNHNGYRTIATVVNGCFLSPNGVSEDDFMESLMAVWEAAGNDTAFLQLGPAFLDQIVNTIDAKRAQEIGQSVSPQMIELRRVLFAQLKAVFSLEGVECERKIKDLSHLSFLKRRQLNRAHDGAIQVTKEPLAFMKLCQQVRQFELTR